jgi:hypothetical protein
MVVDGKHALISNSGAYAKCLAETEMEFAALTNCLEARIWVEKDHCSRKRMFEEIRPVGRSLPTVAKKAVRPVEEHIKVR